MAFVYFFHGGLILSYSFVRIFVYQRCKLFVISVANSFTPVCPSALGLVFWCLWVLKKKKAFYFLVEICLSVLFLTAVFGVILSNLLCYRYSSTF